MQRRGFFTQLLALFLLLTVAVTGCGTTSPTDRDANTVRVTASTGMIADLAQNIGGDVVRVEALMGPGVDPHLYKASQGDIAKMADADLVLYNGLHLEGKMIDVFERIGRDKKAVAVGAVIPQEKLLFPEAFEGNPDPHIWFDVQLWMLATDAVRDALIQVAPEHKATFEANATQYKKQLESLDAYAREQIAAIARDQRVLVTAHDAFGYFGNAYDIDVQGLQGISTDAEYGIKDVQNLVDTLVERKIKAVFVESSVPKKAIEAVVEGAKARGHHVMIGGELFSDALGDAGTLEGTYIGMVRHNVDAIAKSLK